jgi:N-dimethylarginine dimethylaminohydrolase
MSNNIIDFEQCISQGLALPDVQAIKGERWFPLDTNIEQDMIPYWGGDWGCSSEYTRLRAVLLHRPENEVENFDFDKVRFREPVDVKKFQSQHDELANYYRSHGVEVFYTEKGRDDRPNSVFCRDKLFMTPEGAIVARLAMAERRGEERFVSEALGRIGVPIVKTISGNGIFEGANAMWIDRYACILSLSVRANREGYEQMEYELRRQGVKDIIQMQIPYGHAHIDGLLNIASSDVAIIHASQVPYVVVDALKKKGYKIIEAPSQTEVKYNYAVNFVAIEPGHVVTSIGAPRTVELLEKAGVKVDVLDLSELNKGRGSVHCMTAFLKRDTQ